MKISRLPLWGLIGACILMVAPVAVATILAQNRAVQREESLVLRLSKHALQRSDETAKQIQAAARTINQLDFEEACSHAGLDLMRQIDLNSSLLQGVGWIDGNVMRCSSFSGTKPIDLGPPGSVSSDGRIFRTNVRIIDPSSSFVVVQAGSAVGVVHKDLALSFIESVPGLAVNVFSWRKREPIFERGNVSPSLLKGNLASEGVTHTEDHTIGLTRSKHSDTAAIAVLPIGHAATYLSEAAFVLVPVGLLIGACLSAALIYLVRSRSTMSAVIRTALRRREFHLLYQPVIDLQQNRIIGAEALIRWRRPNGEVVTPDAFIPAAEQAGLISHITARVLEMLGEDAKHILAIAPHFHFAVNFSAADMHKTNILEEITEFVARSGVPTSSLVVEATEQSVMDVSRATEAIKMLRSAGIRVAIDDFGTGYSSLAYLAEMEVDFLKIDKLFVQSLGTGSATSQVAARIIEMAKDLDLSLIAEGIETRQQEMVLKNLGVEFAQGFLYDRPLSVDDLVRRLASAGKAAFDAGTRVA